MILSKYQNQFKRGSAKGFWRFLQPKVRRVAVSVTKNHPFSRASPVKKRRANPEPTKNVGGDDEFAASVALLELYQ
jgi:hypothetical protein